MGRKKLTSFSPGRMLLFSVIVTIITGTSLLALPMARTSSISLIDLFFTATSATCVTGLLTIPLDQFTLFGQFILLLLIQIGGLGLITMTLFLLTLFIDLGMGTQFMAGQILELETGAKMKQLLLFIVVLTLSVEFIGTLFTFFALHPSTEHPLFYAAFHAVSSFCNAGISVATHMTHYRTNYLMLLTTTILMFIGGFGFITWHEILEYIQSWIHGKRYNFSLQSKIIFFGSTALLTTSTIMFWILEHDSALSHISTPLSIVNALFNATAFKSTGYLTFVPGELQIATLFMIMLFAFIGSSPGSTGSGIKITTFAVILASIKAAISGKTTTNIRGRKVPLQQVYKAIAIVLCSLGWIILVTFCLLVTEKNPNFLDLFFEATAAFTTLGISLGISAHLSTVGKLFIILSMIVGRIGSLTLILGLRSKKWTESTAIKYPEERIMLG